MPCWPESMVQGDVHRFLVTLLGVVALRPVGVWRERHRVACLLDSRSLRPPVDALLELALQLARRNRVALAVVDGAHDVRRLRRHQAGELVPLGASSHDLARGASPLL